MKNHLNLKGNTLYSLKFDLKMRLTICLIVCSLFQIHAKTISEIEKTEIEFYHSNWSEITKEFKVASFCWASLLSQMKLYLETGIITPFNKRN